MVVGGLSQSEVLLHLVHAVIGDAAGVTQQQIGQPEQQNKAEAQKKETQLSVSGEGSGRGSLGTPVQPVEESGQQGKEKQSVAHSPDKGHRNAQGASQHRSPAVRGLKALTEEQAQGEEQGHQSGAGQKGAGQREQALVVKNQRQNQYQVDRTAALYQLSHAIRKGEGIAAARHGDLHGQGKAGEQGVQDCPTPEKRRSIKFALQFNRLLSAAPTGSISRRI